MKRLLILFFLLAIISKVYSKQVLFGSDNGNFFFRRDYHEQVKIITSEDFFQNVINKKDEDLTTIEGEVEDNKVSFFWQRKSYGYINSLIIDKEFDKGKTITYQVEFVNGK